MCLRQTACARKDECTIAAAGAFQVDASVSFVMSLRLHLASLALFRKHVVHFIQRYQKIIPRVRALHDSTANIAEVCGNAYMGLFRLSR
jgi:hypothetical protein